jgi:hypothetical protein
LAWVEEIPVAQIRLEKVNVEALLIAVGETVKRLLTFGERGPRREAQRGHLRRPAPNPYE